MTPSCTWWVLIALFSSAWQETGDTAEPDQNLGAEAERIARSSIIVDPENFSMNIFFFQVFVGYI